MISFDDYGGGDGSNINLSPIYNSLSTINEYISTLSNNVVNNYYTTFSYDSLINSGTIMSISRPYLQDFTPSDGTYQYNISGNLDVSQLSFSTDFNVLGAISNVSGTLTEANTIDLKIDKFENFSGVKIDNVLNNLKLSGENIISNTITSIMRGEINADNISEIALNVDDLNVSGGSFIANTITNSRLVNLNVNSIQKNLLSGNVYFINENAFVDNTFKGVDLYNTGTNFVENYISQCNFLKNENRYNYNNLYSYLTMANIFCDTFESNRMSNVDRINLDAMTVSKNGFTTANYINLSCINFTGNTITTCKMCKFYCDNIANNLFQSGAVYDIDANDYKTNTINQADRFSLNAMSMSKNTLKNLLNIDVNAVNIKSNSIAGRTHSSQVLFAEFKNALDFESNTLSSVKFQNIYNYHLWGNTIDNFEYARHLAMTYHGNLIKNGNYLEATASLFWDGNTLSNIQTFHGHANIIEASYENIRSFNINGQEIRNITLSSCEDVKLNFYNYNSNISLNDISNLYLNQYKTQSDIYYNNISRYIVGFAGTSNYLFDSDWNYTLDSSILDISQLYLSEVPYALLTKGGGGGTTTYSMPYMKSYNSTDGNYQYNLSGSLESQTLNLNNSLNYLYGSWNIKNCSFSSKAGVLDIKCVDFATNTFNTVDYLTINVPGGVIGKNQFKEITSLSFNGMFVENSITKVNNMEGRGMMFMYNNITGDLVKINNGIVANNTLNGLSYNLNNCLTIAENEFNISGVLNINAYATMPFVQNKFNGSFVSNDFNKGTLNITCYNQNMLMNTIEKWNVVNINNNNCTFSDCAITNNDIVNITAGEINNSGITTYSNIKTLNLSVSGTISNAIFENIDYLNISAASLEKCTFRSLKTCDLFEVSGINVSNNNCDFSSIVSLKYPLLHPASISIDMYNGTQGTLPGDSILNIDFKSITYNLVSYIKAASATYVALSNYFWGAASDCYWNGVNFMVFK